jgi:hypothetical protein
MRVKVVSDSETLPPNRGNGEDIVDIVCTHNSRITTGDCLLPSEEFVRFSSIRCSGPDSLVFKAIRLLWLKPLATAEDRFSSYKEINHYSLVAGFFESKKPIIWQEG